ncbi:MAG TPA: GAF domain-containing protein [Aggregatilineales bacterium]|nr:GAF domain-containing protein [Aggregatilineales bacterium]
MSQSLALKILAAIRSDAHDRYRKGLSQESQFEIKLVPSIEAARESLDSPGQQTDVLVIDNMLGDTYEIVREIRYSYPRLIIILVDEDADFALPGRADDVSTAPFENNDLITRIKRLNEDRRLQTLRADALPPVREFAKSILKAGKGTSKQQAAVEAVREIGYDYVAFYALTRIETAELMMVAQVGGEDLKADVPRKPEYDSSLMGWVAQNGQSRIVSPDDEFNHPFVQHGIFQTAACVPVGTTLRFGVLVACRKVPQSISQENVMMLELISAQLASALAKEQR